MENPNEQGSVDDRKIYVSDAVEEYGGEDLENSPSVESAVIGSGGSSSVSPANGGSDGEIGLTERLTDILVEDGDGDLLLQRSNRETRVLQWLQALDLQVMGACRADERLKPLLKLNVSNGVAEDRLLDHLIQHFDAAEVGKLARCLCIPLVSIRVGKIIKQGTLLCPTATRGNLNLTLLPTSEMRIAFIGDDGYTERLSTLSSISQCSAVAIEEIPADNSGRSFLIKIPDCEVLYFWCSEKSKLLGIELLAKMKDLLKRKPSLAELTGISESRLDCFATHLRAYLVGSSMGNARARPSNSPSSSMDTIADPSELGQNAQFLPSLSKPSRSRHNSSQAVKPNSLYQCSLSPRPSSFKEGLPRNLSSLRNAAREKFKRRGESHFSAVDNLPIASCITMDAPSSNSTEKDKLPEVVGTYPFSESDFLESLGKSAAAPLISPSSQIPSIGSSLFAPYYCWCPPRASSLQYTVAPSQLPIIPAESLSLPPLSSLLPASRSSNLLTPTPSLNVSGVPSVDFPAFLPDPLVRLPFSMASSQQIATFTPLMCDPIVHIPVIDVCSSGQGYLVSAGPTISTTIPPLHPKLVNPLIPETESAVEKGARETLRLLINSSSQNNPQLMDVLPAVLTNADEKHSLLVVGSRGLYNGTRDVDAIANSIVGMSLVSLSGRSIGSSVMRSGDLGSQAEHAVGSFESCLDDQEGPYFPELREEKE